MAAKLFVDNLAGDEVCRECTKLLKKMKVPLEEVFSSPEAMDK